MVKIEHLAIGMRVDYRSNPGSKVEEALGRLEKHCPEASRTGEVIGFDSFLGHGAAVVRFKDEDGVPSIDWVCLLSQLQPAEGPW